MAWKDAMTARLKKLDDTDNGEEKTCHLCTRTDVCPNCGYCDRHHFIKIVDVVITQMEDSIGDVIEDFTERLKKGKFDIVTSSIIALIDKNVPNENESYLGELSEDSNERVEEVRLAFYTYFDTLVGAIIVSSNGAYKDVFEGKG